MIIPLQGCTLAIRRIDIVTATSGCRCIVTTQESSDDIPSDINTASVFIHAGYMIMQLLYCQ